MPVTLSFLPEYFSDQASYGSFIELGLARVFLSAPIVFSLPKSKECKGAFKRPTASAHLQFMKTDREKRDCKEESDLRSASGRRTSGFFTRRRYVLYDVALSKEVSLGIIAA
jgi:hypothetical protein